MPVTFFIRDVSRQPFSTKALEIEIDATVRDLKTHIFDRYGIPISIQSLTFGTSCLDQDGEKLLNLGLEHFSTITLDIKFSKISFLVNNKESTNTPVLNFTDPIQMSEDTFSQFQTTMKNQFYTVTKISDTPKNYLFTAPNLDEKFVVMVKSNKNKSSNNTMHLPSKAHIFEKLMTDLNIKDLRISIPNFPQMSNLQVVQEAEEHSDIDEDDLED